MAPTRVGFIGLGPTNNALMPGGWGAGAHLPYLRASPKYEVVAVANSSVASSQSSIDFHKLGPKVKAYGSAEDLARDPDVDLIVVSVRVGKHLALTKPALLAGKDVFVEWPLAVSNAEEEELVRLAHNKGVRAIVGAQGRASSYVAKMKELVASGQIGKVTSSTVLAACPPIPWDTWFESAAYYLDIESGGNTMIVTFGHFFDSFIHVLGDFDPLHSVIKVDHPTSNLMNEKFEITHANYPKTTPDYISVQGSLSSGAAASITFRSPPGLSVDGVGWRWVITGTEGEIELTTPLGLWQMISADGVTLKARIGKGPAEVKSFDFGMGGEAAELQEKTVGENTARLYEALAAGDAEKYATFEQAMKTHSLLDKIRRAAA